MCRVGMTSVTKAILKVLEEQSQRVGKNQMANLLVANGVPVHMRNLRLVEYLPQLNGDDTEASSSE